MSDQYYFIMKFHWKFWKPLEVIGGVVFMGHYYEVWHNGKLESLQTEEQIKIKGSMGFFR